MKRKRGEKIYIYIYHTVEKPSMYMFSPVYVGVKRASRVKAIFEEIIANSQS